MKLWTACYNANRDILSIYSNPEISIGAISKTEKKEFHQNTFRSKYSKSNWRGIHGTVAECKFLQGKTSLERNV